jgi:hypothetical protein
VGLVLQIISGNGGYHAVEVEFLQGEEFEKLQKSGLVRG